MALLIQSYEQGYHEHIMPPRWGYFLDELLFFYNPFTPTGLGHLIILREKQNESL